LRFPVSFDGLRNIWLMLIILGALIFVPAGGRELVMKTPSFFTFVFKFAMPVFALISFFF
jgi:fucose 4-O-acetylase-like acetyltransferase